MVDGIQKMQNILEFSKKGRRIKTFQAKFKLRNFETHKILLAKK